MATSEVKLYGTFASPFVIRVKMALKLKSIEYEFLEENPHQKSEFLLKNNPVYKKIPILIHYDKPICESLIIVQYIDDSWTNHGLSILPSDPYDRAIARFWGHFIDDKWFPLFKELGQVKEDEARKAVMEKIVNALMFLEEAFVICSKGGAYFGGDNVGYVDIALGCYLGWMRVAEKSLNIKFFHEDKTPSLAKWAENLCSYSPVKDVIPDIQTLEEYRDRVYAKAKSAS